MLAAVATVVFLAVERRVKSPMLDLSLFARPPMAGSNFVAFASYFGIFSIFFFTALYLQVVANASAYQTAIDFAADGGRADPLLDLRRPLGRPDGAACSR